MVFGGFHLEIRPFPKSEIKYILADFHSLVKETLNEKKGERKVISNE